MTLRPALAVGLAAGLGAALLGAGCAAPQAGGCGAREVVLRNASALPIEQAYGGPGGPGAWGAELLGADLPPGASRALRLPAATRAVRLVWANGRAVEIADLDTCAISRLVLTDTALQPER